jgi:hypothetical protein
MNRRKFLTTTVTAGNTLSMASTTATGVKVALEAAVKARIQNG